MSILRLGRSSSLSGPSTCSLYSDVSSNTPVLKDHGVCWNDEVNNGWDGGGVVGCRGGLVSAIRSNTAVHMSASFASLRTRCMRGIKYLTSRALEVMCDTSLERSPIRGSFPARERMTRAAG